MIEAKDGSVAGTIELGGKPEFAAADGRGSVFVNLEDKNTLVKIDARKLAVLEPLAGRARRSAVEPGHGHEPSPALHRLP